MRADELKLIEHARAHPTDVYQVLESSVSRRDRIAAAWVAGYTPKGKDQIMALLGAISDKEICMTTRSVNKTIVLGHLGRDARRNSPQAL
jgi:hypothetical protein